MRKAVVAACGITLVAWFFFGGGLDLVAARGVKQNNLQVAEAAVAEYDIALRNGDKTKACFRAGMAASAYLSARAEGDYRKWQAVYDSCK